ncbi:hypothetical protein [Haladaptatus sp. NG-WS-4]
MQVFIDATTLISLGTIGELNLLTNVAGDLVILPLVGAEVTTEPAQTNLTRFVNNHEVRTDDPAVHDRINQAKEVLGEPTENGDVHLIAAVLAYTNDDRSIGVISDDRRVRTTARGLGATVTGTIGVIVRAVDEGLPPQDARELVDRVDSHGLHMTGNLREKAYSLIDDAADTSLPE